MSAPADGDWFEREVHEAQADWERLKAEGATHAGEGQWCDLCIAGDGDGRCQRCGCSVGMPGCQCAEGPLAGPCLKALGA